MAHMPVRFSAALPAAEGRPVIDCGDNSWAFQWTRSTGSSIRGITFRNCHPGPVVRLDNSMFVGISDCSFEDSGRAVRITNAVTVSIDGTNFSNCTGLEERSVLEISRGSSSRIGTLTIKNCQFKCELLFVLMLSMFNTHRCC